MVRKAIRVCLGAAALIIVGTACVFVLTPATTSASPIGQTAQSAKNSAVDAIIDSTGVKTAVQDALTAHSLDIANATGISSSQVQNIIENLDIEDWQAATLPANAMPNSVISGSAAGVPATLTTYSDPNYVSISAYGQDIDLQVPVSAQQYMPLLAYAAA